MISRRALVHVALLVTLWLTLAVRASQSAPPPAVFAYSATAEGKLYGFRVNDNGDLQPLANGAAVVSVMERPMMAAHPSGRYLYVAQAFDEEKEGLSRELDLGVRYEPKRLVTELRVLRIEAGSDRLRLIQIAKINGLVGGLRPHPGGKYLHCICYDGGVLIYRMAADGKLKGQGRTEVARTFSAFMQDPTDWGGWDVTFTPDGKYVYNFHVNIGSAARTSRLLQCYRVLTDGRFKAVGPERLYVSGDGDASYYGLAGLSEDVIGRPAFHPTSNLVLITRNDRVHLYRWGANGQITQHPQKSLPFPKDPKVADQPCYVRAVDPRGKYIVIGEDYKNSLNAVYRVGADGRLAFTDSFPGPGALRIVPSGRLLYELQESNYSAFRIDNRGKVKKIMGPKPLARPWIFVKEKITDLVVITPRASGTVK